MATTFFNDVAGIAAHFQYSPDNNKTVMHLLIDTHPRIPGEATQHEECAIMFRGGPKEFRAALKEALRHFMDQSE